MHHERQYLLSVLQDVCGQILNVASLYNIFLKRLVQIRCICTSKAGQKNRPTQFLVSTANICQNPLPEISARKQDRDGLSSHRGNHFPMIRNVSGSLLRHCI